MFPQLKRIANNEQEGSLADRMRRRRFQLFREMVEPMGRPLRILDVGGTQMFWERMGFGGEEGVEITLLNLRKQDVDRPGFVALTGDARDLSQFADKQFDIAFSNSVIEHVGSWDDQQQMASEMLRVGQRVFLQTPNKCFPLEPHFLFPFFQFLPMRLRVWLVRHFSLGWYKRIPDKQQAEKECRQIRLLRLGELKKLFPGARIEKEKYWGLGKSFVVIIS
jgi:2-polyprenyl-3-methyl-5-hydroxy-6-metoxy-1,4-benzoquinol methylase